MKTQYDKQANAFYISFTNGKAHVAKTVKLNNFLLVDIDKKGKIYGIEILNASTHIPVKFSLSKQKSKTKS
ncbi:DUF2283 domain-containing protein [Candidatus Peregrinibacteria bacterium]|nr:DUF2283 domain-containing protein [Candidatus Peregrinibacteria bacterium]